MAGLREIMFSHLVSKDIIAQLSYVTSWLVVSKFYPSASHSKQTVSTIESWSEGYGATSFFECNIRGMPQEYKDPSPCHSLNGPYSCRKNGLEGYSYNSS